MAVRAVLGFLLLLNASALLADKQCERLFTEINERATCSTLLGMRSNPVPDDELRELVSRQVYGLSPSQAEAAKKKRKEQEEEAAGEIAAKLEKSQCGRLFADAFERDVCIWDSALSGRAKKDEELRQSAANQIEKMKTDRAFRDSVIATIRKLRRDDIQDRIYEREAEQRRIVEERGRARQAEIAKARRLADEKKRFEAANAAARRLDEGLKTGPIGFVARKWELGGLGTVLIVQFWLQNNTKLPAKDFEIVCQTAGQSGTPLSSAKKVLYQSLDPTSRQAFELNFGFVEPQSTKVHCAVGGWK